MPNFVHQCVGLTLFNLAHENVNIQPTDPPSMMSFSLRNAIYSQTNNMFRQVVVQKKSLPNTDNEGSLPGETVRETSATLLAILGWSVFPTEKICCRAMADSLKSEDFCEEIKVLGPPQDLPSCISASLWKDLAAKLAKLTQK